MANMEFTDKFIGYVDVLGFKQLVEKAESGHGMSLDDILGLLKEFGSSDERALFDKYGPTTCPHSRFNARNLDFRITPITDCVIVSTEVSPAGVINMIAHCWGIVIKLLPKGIMCRGYITQGPVYHTDTQFIGSGYQNAYEKERQVTAFKRQADERGTPFVEIDPAICKYVNESGDHCVKEMFARFTKHDGGVVALFPFQQLATSFTISAFGPKLDPDKEKTSNANLRKWITNFKAAILANVDQSNPRAVRKAEHYIEALNAQLEMCDKTDRMIDRLCSRGVG
jgi:hypothetical protein